jgi:hypothetical protein
MPEGLYTPFSEDELSRMEVRDRIAATEVRLGSIEEDFFRWAQSELRYHFDDNNNLVFDKRAQIPNLPDDAHWIKYLTARKDYYDAKLADPTINKNIGEQRKCEFEQMRSGNALRVLTGKGQNGYLLIEIAGEIRERQQKSYTFFQNLPEKVPADGIFVEIWKARTEYANQMVSAMEKRFSKVGVPRI